MSAATVPGVMASAALRASSSPSIPDRAPAKYEKPPWSESGSVSSSTSNEPSSSFLTTRRSERRMTPRSTRSSSAGPASPVSRSAGNSSRTKSIGPWKAFVELSADSLVMVTGGSPGCGRGGDGRSLVDEVATVEGHRPDDGDVEGDDEDAPHGVMRQPGEARHHADRGHDHGNGPGPERSAEQRETGEGDEHAEEEVDPAPGRDVELEDVLLAQGVELVVEQRDQTLDGMEDADHDHEHTGEDRHADCSTAVGPVRTVEVRGQRGLLVGHGAPFPWSCIARASRWLDAWTSVLLGGRRDRLTRAG